MTRRLHVRRIVAGADRFAEHSGLHLKTTAGRDMKITPEADVG
jgi:hypothetical protein